MKKLITTIILICLSSILIFAQSKPIAKKISDIKTSGATFKKIKVLDKKTSTIYLSKTSSFVKNATFAELDSTELSLIYTEQPELIEFVLPYENDSIILELVKTELFANDFQLLSSNTNNSIPYEKGAYYQGIIKNEPASLVALSFFKGEMFGIVSGVNNSNINIGRYQSGLTTDYIIYSDRDIIAPAPLGTCSTIMNPDIIQNLSTQLQDSEGSRTAKCPKIYFEADYDIYLNYGAASVTGTADYITALYNNASAIFNNEFVSTELLTIFVWTEPDMYSDISAGDKLASFSTMRPTFLGDVAQLLAMYGGGGGVASTVNGLCTSLNYSVCFMSGDYAEYPTYSWPVFVMTHELGHLFGSAHTQSCFAWVGGALDNCYTTEGGCEPGPAPIDGGTIMSYCHVTAYGVNFANGFGLQPGDAIRNTINNAFCIDACGIYEYNPYCYPYGLYSENQWIQSVKMGGVFNNSGNNGGYGDYTGITIPVIPGADNIIKITPAYLGTPYNVAIGVWIDFNKDGDFIDSGELVINEPAITSTLTATIFSSIENTGTTRMRIMLKYGGPITNPCDFYLGETEDYIISFDTPITYCNTGGAVTSTRFIDYVKFNSLTRISGNDGGYFEYNDITTSVAPGNTYSFSYSAGFPGAAEQMYWRVWIDFNRDGDFFDANEKIIQKKTNTAGNTNKMVSIPIDVIPGYTGMRVSSKYGSYPGPCENFASGEVEDYVVQILPALIFSDTNHLFLSIYPNPAVNLINIQFEYAMPEEKKLEITDMAGTIIYTCPVFGSSGNLHIDLNKVSKGIYVVKLVQPDGTFTIQKLCVL
jgi:hypothetical protein